MTSRSLSFTYRPGVRVNRLVTPVLVCEPGATFGTNPTAKQALWDTGAQRSMITAQLAAELGLVKRGALRVSHAGGETVKLPTYVVDIVLPNNARVGDVLVAATADLQGIDVLVGMDLIGLGDFAVTKENGATVMSFRVPSRNAIDFVPKKNRTRALPGRNQRCPCGSGSKFKKCCGRPGSSAA